MVQCRKVWKMRILAIQGIVKSRGKLTYGIGLLPLLARNLFRYAAMILK